MCSINFDEATSSYASSKRLKRLKRVYRRGPQPTNRRSNVIAATAARPPTCWMSTAPWQWSLLATSLATKIRFFLIDGHSPGAALSSQGLSIGKCSTSKVSSLCLPQVEGCPQGRLISFCEGRILFFVSVCISSTLF